MHYCSHFARSHVGVLALAAPSAPSDIGSGRRHGSAVEDAWGWPCVGKEGRDHQRSHNAVTEIYLDPLKNLARDVDRRDDRLKYGRGKLKP